MTFYEIGLEDDERAGVKRFMADFGQPLTEAAAVKMLIRQALAAQAGQVSQSREKGRAERGLGQG